MENLLVFHLILIIEVKWLNILLIYYYFLIDFMLVVWNVFKHCRIHWHWQTGRINGDDTHEEETQGIIAELKNECSDEGKLEVLDLLLKSYTIEEITNFFGMPFEDAFNVSRD